MKYVDAQEAHGVPASCGKLVYWWDGEYEGNCELPSGHNGDHFDGLSWFDDSGQKIIKEGL